jgi:hypothetical protein
VAAACSPAASASAAACCQTALLPAAAAALLPELLLLPRLPLLQHPVSKYLPLLLLLLLSVQRAWLALPASVLGPSAKGQPPLTAAQLPQQQQRQRQ